MSSQTLRRLQECCRNVSCAQCPFSLSCHRNQQSKGHRIQAACRDSRRLVWSAEVAATNNASFSLSTWSLPRTDEFPRDHLHRSTTSYQFIDLPKVFFSSTFWCFPRSQPRFRWAVTTAAFQQGPVPNQVGLQHLRLLHCSFLIFG